MDSGGILQDTALENASNSLSISQAIKSMLFVLHRRTGPAQGKWQAVLNFRLHV